MCNVLFLTIFIFTWYLVTISVQDCSLDVRTTSLIVTNENFTLPLHGPLHLKQNQSFFARCPSGTTNPQLQEDGEKLTCQNNTSLRIESTNQTVDFLDLDCVLKNLITVKKTNNTCGTNGVEVDVGFEIFQEFAPAYKVCFDEEHLAPLNVSFFRPFYIDPLNAENQSRKLFLDTGKLYGGINVGDLYKNQKDIFKSLGLSAYINDEVYLTPTPLIPANFFYYSLSSQGVFDYVTVVPQWSSLNNTLMNVVADQLLGNQYFPVVIGAFGVATLPGAGDLIELYLSDGKVPVPRWLFYLSNQNLILYAYNNPFFVQAEVDEEFQQICAPPNNGGSEIDNNMYIGFCYFPWE